MILTYSKLCFYDIISKVILALNVKNFLELAKKNRLRKGARCKNFLICGFV